MAMEDLTVKAMIPSMRIALPVAMFLLNSDRVQKAIAIFSECLILLNNANQKCKDQFISLHYSNIYKLLFCAYLRISDYINAERYGRKLLVLCKESGDLVGEGDTSMALAQTIESQNRFTEAKQLYEKTVDIRRQTDENAEEADSCVRLGHIFYRLGENLKTKEYIERALAIKSKIGDKIGEAACFGSLGALLRLLGQNDKAIEYQEKALVIRTEIGDSKGEALSYASLGSAFQSLGKYDKAKEYYEKALAIRTEIGDREGEAADYGNLGTVFQSLGKYDKAKEYYEKALAMRTEIGNREGEAVDYGNLGAVFQSLGKYDKAIEYLEKALAIRTEISDRKGEAADYGNLGIVFKMLGKYDKAKEYYEKAIAITTEIGDREGEAADYGNLGTLFKSLGKYDKAEEYYEKSLAITTEIGDRKGEAAEYGNLGTVFQSLGKYDKAIEYHEIALAITTEIGDRGGEASSYGNLGTVFHSLGKYDKAIEYMKKALFIAIEIGDKKGEASNLTNLGKLSIILRDYGASEVYLKKALSISRDIGDRIQEFNILKGYAVLYLFQNKIEDSLSCLHQCIEKYEERRNFLGDSDEFKTSFLEDSGIFPHKLLSRLLCQTGNGRDDLYVEELSRARGLSNLMAEKYLVETHISANPQSWFGIENILRKENNCTCLYISYYENEVHLWILKTNGAIHFKRIALEENLVQAGLPKDLSLGTYLADNFRSLGILPSEDCEDRSLNMDEWQSLTPEQKSSARVRLVEKDKDVISSLSLCYKIFIAPVYDLLEEPEVIIVPHSTMYKVPFAALSEKEGAKYLSETRRIRVIPSLTTLEIIKDSPEDYHINSGALIVGNPKCGWLSSLPGAEKEAEMVGRLVGVAPLIGEKATKQAVLEKIGSVSLIHFAAHGNAERGEIALSPISTPNGPNPIPPKEAYMLTMADVSRVKVRAKLVVLSCCHSGSGQVTAEGVIGIARAFLGSGARSVLVALWAIPDSATKHLMRQFYEHLAEGGSAGESLHQAMKWMRNNGFTKVSEWASFTLIGDDVRLDFGRQRKKDPDS